MNELFKFIKDRFLSMPEWVQISTYIAFVILFIYLFTAPRFLDMRLVSNDYGDEFPIGGAQIEVEIEGRVLLLLTDSKGRFSVPISTHFPLDSYLFILSPDPESNKIKEIEVPVSNSYLNRSKIIYSKTTNEYQIVPNGILENTKDIFAELNLINTAYADNLDPKIAQDGIDKEILKSLEVITKISVKNIPLTANLKTDLELDNIDLSYISNRLNKKYQIDAFNRFQRSAKTVNDLIEIARSLYHKDYKVKSSVSINVLQNINDTLLKLPNDLVNKYKLAKLLIKAQRFTTAINILQDLIHQQPNFYLAWVSLATSYAELNNVDKAENAFQKAIELEKENRLNDAQLYNAYGIFLLNSQRYSEAYLQLKKAKELNSSTLF